MTQAERSRKTAEARKYIARIRNERKRAYATAYFNHLVGFSHEPDEAGLSCMAAQGVRMQLAAIYK